VAPVKSEYLEHLEVASWLRIKGVRFQHSPNDTYTTSFKAKMANKRKGVSPGFPDFLVVTPNDGLVFVELKRTKGGRVSNEQREWLIALGKAGCPSVVCAGAKEAIAFLGKYIQ
jgi:hypothetical protein